MTHQYRHQLPPIFVAWQEFYQTFCLLNQFPAGGPRTERKHLVGQAGTGRQRYLARFRLVPRSNSPPTLTEPPTMLGLKTFSMLGSVVTVLQVSRPPMANDTPRYWLLVWNRLGASAPEIVGFFQMFFLAEVAVQPVEPMTLSPRAATMEISAGRNLLTLKQASRNICKGYTDFPSGSLTLLALVHFFLDICRENLNISVCIDFSSHRWPKFCIWNVQRTCSEICPAGGRLVRGGPRLPCSSLLLRSQFTLTTTTSSWHWSPHLSPHRTRKTGKYVSTTRSFDRRRHWIWNCDEMVKFTAATSDYRGSSLLLLAVELVLVLVNHLIVHMDSDWLLNHYWRFGWYFLSKLRAQNSNSISPNTCKWRIRSWWRWW